MVLVRSEVLGQFFNTITAVYNYIRQNLENLRQQVQTQISLKPKTFSGFFIALMKSTLNLEYFEKEDQSHSLSITEINNCKTSSYLSVYKAIFHVNGSLGNLSCKQRFGSQHVNGSQTLLRSAGNNFHTAIPLI